MSFNLNIPKGEAFFSLLIILIGAGILAGALLGSQLGEVTAIGVIALGVYLAYRSYQREKQRRAGGAIPVGRGTA